MFKFTKIQNDVGVLEMNNPNGSANLIGDSFIEEFLPEIKKAFSENIRGLVITSAKNDFMAGGDLNFILAMSSTHDVTQSISRLHEAFSFLETQSKPVVAIISGAALGGGLELALACHYRIAIDDPKTQLGLPEVTLGLLPGGGGTQRLPRLIGIQPSLELLTLGNKIDAQKALKMGVVNEVAKAKDEALEKAVSFILKNPQLSQPWYDKKYKIPGGGVQSPQNYPVFAASNAMLTEKTYSLYPAPKAILSCVYEGLQVPFDLGIKIETRYFAKMVTSQVAKNLIRTLFFGIQECNKGAERPPNISPMPCKKIGILGAGMMGSGIAYASAKASIPVVLKDTSLDFAKKGKGYSEKITTTLFEKRRMTLSQKDILLNCIQPTDDPHSIKDCDLVVETVTEDRKIKAKVTQESEAVMSADSIMASNTSTLPITGLAEASKRPERFIGLHFFSPVDKMPLVEIIMGKKTGPEALAKALDYTKQIKKTPIVVNDGRGFYTSRVFTTYVSEGIHLLKEGINPVLIENGGKMAGMPVGPLAVADEVSIDLIYHIMKQTLEDLGSEAVDKVCLEVSQLFVEKLKRLGRKTQGGFYEYPPQGKKILWPDLASHFPLSKTQLPIEDIKDRLLTIQALETLRCLEDGVLRSHRDGNVGSVLGWGFPAYSGGSLSYVTTVGIEKFIERCQVFEKKCGPRFKAHKSFIQKAFAP